MTAKTLIFPVWLEGTSEQNKAEAERQSLALASHSRAKLTEAERLIGRGKLLADTARGNLEQANDDETQALAETQLAGALAMQGQYTDAIAIASDPAQRRYFEEIVSALEMPDDEKCPCADNEARVDDQDILITPRFEQSRIFSPLHNEVVSVVACSKCGHANARPLKSRLLKHKEAASENEAIAKAKNARMISDAQLLNATA